MEGPEGVKLELVLPIFTGICISFHWENGIWVSRTGINKQQNGNGKHDST